MLISLCWKKRIPSVVGPYLKIILSLQNMVYHYEYVTIILGNRFAMNVIFYQTCAYCPPALSLQRKIGHIDSSILSHNDFIQLN